MLATSESQPAVAPPQRKLRWRRLADHLTWLVPVLVLGFLSPFVLLHRGDVWPLTGLLIETISAFSAFAVVIASLVQYFLQGRRLSLILSFAFLPVVVMDVLGVGATASAVATDAGRAQALWTTGRLALGALLLVGWLLLRYARGLRNESGEALVAASSVLVIAVALAVTLGSAGGTRAEATISTAIAAQRVPMLAAWLLFVAVVPYFGIYRDERSFLWRIVVVALVIAGAGQMWVASVAGRSDLPYLAGRFVEILSYMGILAGLQAWGAARERVAVARAERAAALLQVAQVATKDGKDVERIADGIAEVMATGLGVPRVVVMLSEPGSMAVRSVGCHATSRHRWSYEDSIVPFASFPAVQHVMTSHEIARITTDEHQVLDPDLLEALTEDGLAHATLVPLVARGRCIGVAAVQSADERSALPPGDEDLAIALAAEAATALETARLLAESERQARVQSILYEATASLNANIEPDDVLAQIANQLMRALDIDILAISTWDKARDLVVTITEESTGGQDGSLGNEKVYRLADYPVTRRVLERQMPVAIYLDDSSADPTERELLENFSQNALLMVPVVDKGEAIGLVELFTSQSRHFWPREIELAQAIAQNAGAAMQRARLYALEAERAAQLALMSWLDRAIGDTTPDEATLDQFLRRFRLAFQKGRSLLVYVREPDGEWMHPAASNGLPGDMAGADSMSPLSVRDVEAVFPAENPVCLPEDWEATGSCAADVIFPGGAQLVVGLGAYAGRELALLLVATLEAEDWPDERDRDFLSTLASALGRALTTQKLFKDVAAERERLRTILANTADAVILTTPQAEVLVLSAAAERLFNVLESEAAGLPLAEVFPHAVFQEVAGRIQKRKVKMAEKAEVNLSDGRSLQTVVAPVRSENGTVTGYVLDMADVTEIKRLSEQKSQVLRMASHDLLNPLGQAMGAFEVFVEVIGEPDDQEFREELISNVRSGHQRMNTLIKGLLDLERLAVGKMGIRTLVEVGSLLEDVLKEAGPMARQRGQALTAEIAPELPPIEADTLYMHLAVSNLVNNAIKYTPAGGHITVSAERDNGNVRVAVSDDGMGISVQDQSRLFERFFRADQAALQNSSGNGLGLSLVKSVVELHGGTIVVESAPDEGSTFTVLLPIPSETD